MTVRRWDTIVAAMVLSALPVTARAQSARNTEVLTVPVEAQRPRPVTVPARVIPVTHPDAVKPVTEWAKQPERAEKDQPLLEVSKGRPEVGLAVARDLIESQAEQQPAATYRAVSKLLDPTAAGADPRAAGVNLQLGLYLIRGGKNQVAEEALTKVINLAKNTTVEANTVNTARYELAKLAQTAGRHDEAFTLLKPVIESDPLAVDSVRTAVQSLQSANKKEKVASLCQDLLKTYRYTQALECVRTARNDVPNITEIRLTTYAKLPSLTARELLEITKDQPAVSDRLPGINQCVKGDQPRIRWSSFPQSSLAEGLWGRPMGDTTAGVYLNAGQTEQAPKTKRCFLTCSALSCFLEIERKGTCPAVKSLASYAEYLSKEDKLTLREFVDAMLSEKAYLYMMLGRPGEDTPRALFHLHLALAHVFKRIGDGNRLIETSRYHAQRASDFWKQLTKTDISRDLLP